MSNEVPAYALKIKELSDASGLSQAELARRLSFTRDAFNRYYSGRTRPPVDKLKTMAAFFGVHPNEIDEKRIMLMKQSDVKSPSSVFVSEPKNGRKNFARLSVDMDISASSLSRVLDILQSEKQKPGR